MIGGFGAAGQPVELIEALIRQGATNLTVVNNNAGNGDRGLAALIGAGRVRKMICSFPRQADSHLFDAAYRAGTIELELVAQGNLAERIRAAGAGIGGFFTPTGVGTPLAEGKETRVIDGRGYILEYPIRADFALVKAHAADGLGNLVYRKTARNFGPVMATAARPRSFRSTCWSRSARSTRKTSSLRASTSIASSKFNPTRNSRRLASDRPRRAPQPRSARRPCCRDIPRGSFVNLGIGLPTRVANYLSAEDGVVLHTENGLLGMGPEAAMIRSTRT